MRPRHQDPEIDLRYADKALSEARRALEKAQADRAKAHDKLATHLCPLTLGHPVPVARSDVFTPRSIKVSQEGGQMRWVCFGDLLSYRATQRKPRMVKDSILTQEAFEKIPSEVHALTIDGIARTNKQRHKDYVDKLATAPLTLTEGQRGLMRHLLDRHGVFHFHGMLPRGVNWQSPSKTQSIWQALVQKGVIELVSGKFDENFSSWVVSPGPRLEQACELEGLKIDTKSLARAAKKTLRSR